ncbi:MAG: polymorphic toxin-type HINT domain-containing protein, partial [Clostridium sp.]
MGKEVAVGGDAKITVNNPVKYAGYYYEEESKLYYLNARMYNPTIKRFMQQDTVRGDSQNPNSLNLFAYSGNNPIANYDPTGNFFETFLDVVSLGMSIYDFVKEPSLLNFGMLAWDVVSLVPGIPGSYVAKGFKYADRIDDALDAAKLVDRVDDAYDTLRTLDRIDDAGDALRGVGKASDIAKTADRANQARQAAKASREAFEEVVEKTIKSGGDVVKDGRVIATSAKKAAQRSYEVVAKVNNKMADVQNKIFSKIKNSLSKLQAYGKNKFDGAQDVYNKGRIKSKEVYCNAKTYVTKKPSCFTADTLVKTENGLKPISQVVVGEKIQSVNEDDVEEDSELKTVTNVIETETYTLVNIVVDGEKIQTTKTHPWYVEGKGFTDAEYIIAGDKVLTANGELKVVESIEVEILDEPIIVYNLEVEDNRTYYVGNNEILVHNMCAKAKA